MYKRFLKNTSGNFAIMAAVTMMLLMAGIGAAVDYSAMSTKKKNYQDLADLSVLATARSGETEQSALLNAATKFVNENNVSGEALTTSLTMDGDGRIQVQVSGEYKPMILGMFGNTASNISSLAEAPLMGSEPVNIVFVLDTTYSMSGAKIDSLKTAATALLTKLEEYDSTNLNVSVIPFAQHINVGLGNRGVRWS